MIYTVTLNPALDYNMYLDSFSEGATNRSLREEIAFGGKGINVSFVLKELEEPTVALGFVAGFTGEALEEGLREAGVATDFVRLAEGMTRINVKLKGKCETEVNAAGPVVDAAALEALLGKTDTLREGDTLVLAGSVPPTVPRDIYETIIKRVAPRGVRVVVDAERALLLRILPYHPFLIKPNLRELCDMVGRDLQTDKEIADAAKELQQMGAQNVLVSLGGDGALLLDSEGKLHRSAAVGGKPVNTVGAGDSMVAGFLRGVARGYAHALRLGLAAGGATACKVGLATAAEIAELLKEAEARA